MKSTFPRDIGLFLVGSVLLAYEIVLGGARPSVLSVLTGLLLSPVVLKLDERKRNGNGNNKP